MNKRYIVTLMVPVIGAIVASIVTAIMQPKTKMVETPQPLEVSGGVNGGIGVGAIQEGTFGIGSAGGVGVNVGQITNIYQSPPKHIPSNSTRDNQSQSAKQQLKSDSSQLTAHAPVKFLLKGKITLATGTTESFDGLHTTSERDSTFLDVYPRKSSDKKTHQIDLKEVATVTFGKMIDAPNGMFFEVGIQFKNNRYKKTFVGQEDKLVTAIADKNIDIAFHNIKKIEFN